MGQTRLGGGMVVDPRDEVLGTLEDLVACLRETVERCTGALDRAAVLSGQRRAGMRYEDILLAAERPLIVELMSATLADLQRSGHRFRRAEARALYKEGFTMIKIAELFGVSHQRISALLRSDDVNPVIDEGAAAPDHVAQG